MSLKKLCVFVSVIVSLSFCVSICSAASSSTTFPTDVNLGSVSLWHSDTPVVVRWESQPYYYCCQLSSDNNFNLKNLAYYAVNVWNDNFSCSVTEEASYCDVPIYGATAQELNSLDLFSVTFTSTMNGLNDPVDTEGEGYYYYGTARKEGYIYKDTRIGIVRNGRSTTNYRKTMIHEMGHSLGWQGHCTVSGEIMYSRSELNTTLSLSSNEINHLKQIYDLHS